MAEKNIEDFKEEKICIYKGEKYSARDNGAVLRHSKENSRKRQIDEVWTFGKLDDKGFLRIGGEKINRIVATAFFGSPENEQYVVFHKNYNSQDNHAQNLAWVTKFEFKILQPNIQSQLRMITGKKIEEILSDVSIFRTIDVPNLIWMKDVTQEAADKCLEKYIDLKFSTKDEIESINWNSVENRKQIKNLNIDLHPSLTPNAVVEGVNVKCCGLRFESA